MRKRGVVLLGLGVVLVLLVGLVAVAMSPPVVRRAVVWAVGSMTGRQVTVDDARFDPFRGTVSVAGFRLADRDGAPLATFDRLDVRLRLRSLLRGHVRIHDLVLRNSTVNVIRYESGEFNLADMIRRGDTKKDGQTLDVTVDHFLLDGGLVSLDDRMLHPPRTWRSENIKLQARNVSTRAGGGSATGSSVLNGAPVSVQVDDLRLVPAHLRAVVEMTDGDLAMARVYLPQETPVTIDRGKLSTRIAIVYDAREGARVDGDGRIAEAVVLRRHQRDPVVTAPEIKFAFRDLFAGNDGKFSLARFEATGGATGQATQATASRFAISRLRAVVEAVTWPVQGPARIDIASTVPGGGDISIRGTAQVKPQRADVEVRASGVDLAPWTRFIPTSVRITGVGDARFTVHARLGADLSATARGTAGVNKLVIADGDKRLVAADRAEISGLDVGWPLKVAVGRVRLVRPAAIVERDANGVFPAITALGARPADGAPQQRSSAAAAPAMAKLPGPVQVGEIVVEDGQMGWRDASVKPAAHVDVDAIRVTVRDAVWPPAGPLRVTMQARTPRGGRVNGQGTVTVEPIAADLRVVAEGVDVSAASPYVALPVQIGGRTDANVQIVASRSTETPTELKVNVRGRAAVSRVTVNNGRTQIATAERVAVTGLDAEWPSRVTAERIDLQRPFVLVERDERGGFPLRALATTRGTATAAANGAPAAASPDTSDRPKLAISVKQSVIDDGTVRFVDRSLSPTFTEEMRKLSVRVVGAGTAPSPPAKYQLAAVLDGTSRLSLRGQFGPIGDALMIDGDGELREFLVPRVNAYMRHFVSWEARDGRLTTTMRYRITGDEIDARSEIRVGRLDLIRVAPDDPAQKKIGLPLGMIAGLMKNSRGDIVVAIPVGGRLSDPQFELGEAIWSAIRAIAFKTIAAPVAWIGRLKVGRDSRIEDIEIDPVAFEPGTTKLTAKGTDQIERLSGYLRSSAGAKLVLTPVITIGDIDRLRAEAVEATIQQRSRDRSVSELIAAQRLYVERVPGREPPTTREELIAALRDTESPPEKAAQRLATKRLDVMRDALKDAGIDHARVEPSRDVEGLEAPEGGRIEIALTDRVRPKRGLLAELIQKLAEVFARAKAG